MNLSDPNKAEFKEEKIDIETIEKHLNFEISKDQSVIEYSPDTFKYLRTICDLIQKNDGGMLVIDYGYADSKMHETLQAVNNHKYSNVLENIGDCDITYNINFHSFEKFINLSLLKSLSLPKLLVGFPGIGNHPSGICAHALTLKPKGTFNSFKLLEK